MRIYDQKVNHLTCPLGFRMERTVFSWKADGAKGTRQSAARIRVAEDPQMQRLLADTGFSADADSLGTRVEIPLKPRTRYYWTVTVRTDAGEEETGEAQWFETGKEGESWEAQWITCDSGKSRHPVFEKEISAEKEQAKTGKPGKTVESARLYICGLGLYEVFYKGERIGNEYFTPYCNDYNEWVQYQTFDLTDVLQADGDGTLSIFLGNGWYKGRFGFDGNDRGGFYGDEWKLLAELRVSFTDGTETVTGTDPSWKVRRSKITFSNIYDGEHRDDTLPELPLEQAVLTGAPKGELTARMSLPVAEHERITPVELIRTPAGETVLDMGQEFTGIFELKVHAPAGTTVHIQTGEILQDGNFYNENLRTAKSEYYFITDGRETILKPHFTFYGYRYVKIEGIPDLKKQDFTGIALYSDLEFTGKLTTGHGLLNQFISNVRWGMKGNFLDVPTDCPQRDERMGWTADTQVFVPTANYLADTFAFYGKYLYDMKKEQAVRGGRVPDVVPAFAVEDCSSVWGDAACIIPWALYQIYGDRSILEDQYESMKGWVDYIRSVDGEKHGWRNQFHFGDWLALDNRHGTEESPMGGTDEGFIADIYYAASTGIVAEAAKILGRTEDAREYRKLSEKLFGVVKEEYYSPTGRCCIDTQTAHLLTLKYHLSSDEDRIRRRLRELFRINEDRLETGFVGTPLLGNVLTDNGFSDLAWSLVMNEEYPGWLHEVLLGATTVWERWNSVEDDGSISGTGMNSLNHYAYGSILEWLFRHGAGLDFDANVSGCRSAVMKPQMNWKAKHMSAEYDSPAGKYKIAWKILDERHAELSAEVPFGCTARLTLPHAGKEVVSDTENPMFAQVEDGVCILKPGRYHVAWETDEPLHKVYTADMPVRELMFDPATRKIFRRLFPWAVMAPKDLLDCSVREIVKIRNLPVPEERFRQLAEALSEL